jgi:hypothetical protein
MDGEMVTLINCTTGARLDIPADLVPQGEQARDRFLESLTDLVTRPMGEEPPR